MLDEAKSAAIKTGVLAKQLGGLGAVNVLVVDGAFDKNFEMSARNITNVSLVPVAGLNVYDIMRRHTLVLTAAAVKAIEERLA